MCHERCSCLMLCAVCLSLTFTLTPDFRFTLFRLSRTSVGLDTKRSGRNFFSDPKISICCILWYKTRGPYVRIIWPGRNLCPACPSAGGHVDPVSFLCLSIYSICVDFMVENCLEDKTNRGKLEFFFSLPNQSNMHK